jgi:glycosyltransferase involved in cell wall biosynthesis
MCSTGRHAYAGSAIGTSFFVMNAFNSLTTVVVIADYGYVNGGAGQVTVASVRGLLDKGLNVIFCFGVGPLDSSLPENNPRLTVFDLGLYDLLGDPLRLRAFFQGVWKKEAARKLASLLDRLDPATSVIHLHSWVQSLSVSVIPAICGQRIPLVCTLHDYFSICPNGGLYNYQTRSICKLNPMSFACISTHCDARSFPQKLWRVGRQAVQARLGGMPEQLRHVITVSDFSRALLQPHFNSSTRFYHASNPIDLSALTAIDPSKNKDFLFVGRMNPEKGALFFAQAAEEIGVQASFLGKGPDEDFICAHHPQAKLHGWQHRESALKIMRSARCLVFPSMWYETQGLVVLEAAALGLPAIVADGCAASQAIVDGQTGLLFKQGDKQDLQSKLLQIKQDPELARVLGLAAYERYWSAPYTLSRHTNELLQCYRKILTG